MLTTHGRLQRALCACALYSIAMLSLAFPPASSAGTPAPAVAFNTLPVLQSSTPIPGSTRVPGDFNGDKTSDLVWFNTALSQAGIWTMSAAQTNNPWEGSGVTVSARLTFNVTHGYMIGAIGDFNGDGYADLVFTSAKHDLYMWTNNQHGGWTSSYIGTYPSNWQLIGAGDINGDGNDDLLWLDSADCQFGYWIMQGATRVSYQTIPIACGYYPVGVGYYTSSKQLSVLWSSAAGDLYIWDFKPTGYKAYDLSSYVNGTGFSFAHRLAFGGGYAGAGIGYVVYEQSSDGTYDTVATNLLTRSFDAQGNQAQVTVTQETTASTGSPMANAGGYLIQGNSTNASALYYLSATGTSLSTAGLPDNEPGYTGPDAPFAFGTSVYGSSWTYPTGWSVVGSPANTATAPAWQ